MKFHIIRMNETIEDIMFVYELTFDEIKEENRHIKKWEQLIPGTKIKIPTISSQIDQEVIDMEPFIEDYYPKVDRFEKAFEDEQIDNNDMIDNNNNFLKSKENEPNEEIKANEEYDLNQNDVYERSNNINVNEKKETTSSKEEVVNLQENKQSNNYSKPHYRMNPYLYRPVYWYYPRVVIPYYKPKKY